MAKRLSDTEIWKKKWYREMSPANKCFIKYLVDNCNSSGVWEVDFTLASIMIGSSINKSEITNILGNKIIEFDHGRKWLYKKFIAFQYGEKLNENSPVHKKVIDYLRSETVIPKNGINTLPTTLYDTLYNRGKEEEENKDKEEAMVKEGGVGETSNGVWYVQRQMFLNDELWKEQFCMKKKIELSDLGKMMQDFISDVELKQEFQSNKELKNYFTNKFNKGTLKNRIDVKKEKSMPPTFQQPKEPLI